MKEAVIGIDGSEHSVNALKRFMDLVAPGDWRIILVTIIDEFVVQAAVEAGVSIAKKLEENAERRLEELQGMIEEKGFEAEKIIRVGRPHEDLIRVAEEKEADLIVVGSRGLRGLKRIILGSVSSYVVANSKIPVLVVPMRG